LRNCGHPAHEQAWNAIYGHTRPNLTEPTNLADLADLKDLAEMTDIVLQSHAPPMPSGRVAINGIVSTLQTTMQTTMQTAKLTVRLTQRLTGLNEETQPACKSPTALTA
jgi:PBP1b-binding outer membrane lipoprotein LpoB